MQILNENLQRVEEKLQQVLKDFFQKQKELLRLERENKELKEQLAFNKKKVTELTQTVDVLKIKGLAMDEGSRKEMEKRINVYLKEIDKCLSMLQS